MKCKIDLKNNLFEWEDEKGFNQVLEVLKYLQVVSNEKERLQNALKIVREQANMEFKEALKKRK